NLAEYIQDNHVEEKGYKVVCIRLDDLWTDQFSFISFPLLKSRFFRQSLFEDFPSVSHQQELELEISDNYDQILPQFKKYTEGITYAFGCCRGKLFKKQDFEVAFGSFIADRSQLMEVEYQRQLANIIN